MILRHWIVQPKRATDAPKVIMLADAVDEWERLGYTVEGPFMPEGTQQRGNAAENLLREIRDGKHSIPGVLVQIDRYFEGRDGA